MLMGSDDSGHVRPYARSVSTSTGWTGCRYRLYCDGYPRRGQGSCLAVTGPHDHCHRSHAQRQDCPLWGHMARSKGVRAVTNWLDIMHKIKAGTLLADHERAAVRSVHEAMTGRGQLGGINVYVLWGMLGNPAPEVYEDRSTPSDQPKQ